MKEATSGRGELRVNFMARGVVDSYTVFMIPLDDAFHWNHTTLTGVYSTYMLTVGLLSPIAGAFLERFGPRPLYCIGMLTLMLAMLGALFSLQLWRIYIFDGMLCGVDAASLGMVPAAAMIGRWFERRLSVATAVAYAGFGSGILIIVPLAQSTIDVLAGAPRTA